MLMSRYLLTKPFLVLAPMDDVTDTVFRRIVAECASPELFMTEFINADGMQSVGRAATESRRRYDDKNNVVIAQIWGKNPENFEKSAKELVDCGYYGVDINFGCPEKNVVSNGCCSAMIKPEGRDLAVSLIAATRRGVGKDGFLSVKTRLGFSSIDYTWHELLLRQKVNMLTVHVRTRKEMSKVPANYEAIRPIVELRDNISPDTLLVVNGDITDRTHALRLIEELGVDGAMIGRGVFHNPYCFAAPASSVGAPLSCSVSEPCGTVEHWQHISPQDKLNMLRKHVELFDSTWSLGERKFNTLKKFAKVYVSGFDGAKELREQIMATNSCAELMALLSSLSVVH